MPLPITHTSGVEDSSHLAKIRLLVIGYGGVRRWQKGISSFRLDDQPTMELRKVVETIH